MRKNKRFALSDTRDGDRVVILDTGPEEVMVQALRFGLDSGSFVTVEKNIIGGPVIVSRNHLEIAIGREIAENISVELAGD